MKITLVTRKGNYIYIEYSPEEGRNLWTDYTIGSKKSAAKLSRPTHQAALKFAGGVRKFNDIPDGASYTEPQAPAVAVPATDPGPVTKVILTLGAEPASIGGWVHFPAEVLPREDFTRLYKAGAMWKDPDMGDVWVIHESKAKALGYTFRPKGEPVSAGSAYPAGWGFRDDRR